MTQTYSRKGLSSARTRQPFVAMKPGDKMGAYLSFTTAYSYHWHACHHCSATRCQCSVHARWTWARFSSLGKAICSQIPYAFICGVTGMVETQWIYFNGIQRVSLPSRQRRLCWSFFLHSGSWIVGWNVWNRSSDVRARSSIFFLLLNLFFLDLHNETGTAVQSHAHCALTSRCRTSKHS
jgi:hypothetical protein